MKSLFKYLWVLFFLMNTFALPAYGLAPGDLSKMIYQPWGSDTIIDKAAWNTRCASMAQLGIRELVVQWMAHGDTQFLDLKDKTHGTPIPELILDAAANQGLMVRMGLWHGPEFLNQLDGSDDDVAGLLTSTRQKSIQLAKHLLQKYGTHPAFGGWYLPEEIDDRHWRTPARQKLLIHHLKRSKEQLYALAPKKTVVVSAFFSGQMTPVRYAEMWKRVHHQTGTHVWFQDGLGTGRLTLMDTRLYRDSLVTALGHSPTWGWVTELFNDVDSGDGFSGAPASPSEVHPRILFSKETNPPGPRIGFSLRYFLGMETSP